MVLCISNDVFKAHRFFGKKILGLCDHKFRKTQLSGNLKSIRFTRNTDRKTICRPERGYIKFNGCVFNARSRQRKLFQLAVMGCRHRAGFHREQRGENRLRKRSTLRRICTGTQFIKKNQRFRRHMLDD